MSREHLTDLEKIYVGMLKKEGVLEKIPAKEKGEWSLGGGILITCGDGGKDIRSFHKRFISCCPTAQMLAGGPLNYSKRFLQAKTGIMTGSANYILYNYIDLKKYMEAKKTHTMFVCFHFPCGAALDTEFSLKDIIKNEILMVAAKFKLFSKDDPDFDLEKMHYLMHLKKINSKGEEEQNTYIINLRKLREKLSIL